MEPSPYGKDQVYASLSLSTLKKYVEVWDKQRTILPDHLKEITDFQIDCIKKYRSPKFVGILIICELNEKYYIIDGQHRYLSALKLLDQNLIKESEFYFDTMLIQVKNENEIMSNFQLINKLIPVPYYVISPKEIVNKVFEKLHEKYKDQFTNASKVNRPKIDVDNFKNLLRKFFDSDSFNFLNAEDFIRFIENFDYYVKKDIKENGKNSKFINSESSEEQRYKFNFSNQCINSQNYLIFGMKKKDSYNTYWYNWAKEYFEQYKK